MCEDLDLLTALISSRFTHMNPSAGQPRDTMLRLAIADSTWSISKQTGRLWYCNTKIRVWGFFSHDSESKPKTPMVDWIPKSKISTNPCEWKFLFRALISSCKPGGRAPRIQQWNRLLPTSHGQYKSKQLDFDIAIQKSESEVFFPTTPSPAPPLIITDHFIPPLPTSASIPLCHRHLVLIFHFRGFAFLLHCTTSTLCFTHIL